MAGRELSGKDLLDQLYRGLDTVQPTVEAELDAHELLGIAPVPSTDSASAKAFAPQEDACFAREDGARVAHDHVWTSLSPA